MSRPPEGYEESDGRVPLGASRLAAWLVRCRVWLAIVAAVLTAVAVNQAQKLEFSQSIQTMSTGTRTGSCTVATTVSTEGATTLALTINSGGTVKAGDVFTIANCYAVNPQTRQSTGSLYQFVVREDTTAVSTTLTLTVAPMYSASQALATMDALPRTALRVAPPRKCAR